MSISRIAFTAATFTLLASTGTAQDDLIKKISGNKSDTVGFRFTTVISAEATPVEDQGSSGTCWSYSTGSFLESEMIKKGGPAIHLSKVYTARRSYEEKAVNYLRMHGSLNYGDGGLGHDVVNMYGKYGAIPQEAYTGLNFGNDENEFAEMQGVLKGMLDALMKAPNDGKLTPCGARPLMVCSMPTWAKCRSSSPTMVRATHRRPLPRRW